MQTPPLLQRIFWFTQSARSAAAVTIALILGSSLAAADDGGHAGARCEDRCGNACCEDTCCSDVGCSAICCGDACGHGTTGPLGGRLLSFVKPSEPCFNDWISPITNPVFFEDPRTLTEARAIFLHHNVPAAAGDGDIQLYALQLRGALTDRLSVIATKDGYAVSSNPLIDDGWGDVGGGIKYNVYRDVQNETLLSAGLTYEAPVGSRRSHQGNGSGEFNFFFTGGTEFADRWHWLSAGGVRVAVNGNRESSSLYWSNHIDRRFCGCWYAIAECNWFNWIDGGTGGIPGVEGFDLFNFGSSGVRGNDVVTGALGLKYKPSRFYEIGFAWEAPLTDREDVIDNRLNVNFIRRY